MPDEATIRKAFQTYSNYVSAFAHVADVTHVPEKHSNGFTVGGMNEARVVEGLCRTFRLNDRYNRVRSKSPATTREIEKSLANAWATELVLAVMQDSLPEEALPISAQWGVVQAYYVTYQATRAVALATGNDKVLESHPSVQRFFQSFWCTSALRIRPMSLQFSAAGLSDAGTALPHDPVHNLQTVGPHNCLGFTEMALRTTFDEFVKDDLERARQAKARSVRTAWEETEKIHLDAGGRAHKRPDFPSKRNLTPLESDLVRSKTRAASLIDLLYRLRIGANYENALVYSEGATADFAAYGFLRDLRMVVAVILASSEMVVRAYAGASVFDPLVQRWCQKERGKPRSGTLLARQELLLG